MVYTKEIKVSSQGFCDLENITDQVNEIVTQSKIKNGLVAVFVAGSTAGVTTIEYEPGLIEDFKKLMERLVPEKETYAHNSRWGDGNGFSHIRASLLGPSLTVPIINGSLVTGTWQQIVVVDFDNRPRQRMLLIQVIGE